MKIMFEEILCLYQLNTIIMDCSRDIAGIKEGYEYACKEWGENLLPKRSHLIREILKEFEDNIYPIEHYKAEFDIKFPNKEWTDNLNQHIKDYIPLHKKFLLSYISGEFDKMPKEK